ncbi:MAG: hypothetical protein MJZ51_03325 [Bacteroidales bacterium]|nr:hypothetical protein [Bacteroidales bacterium]
MKKIIAVALIAIFAQGIVFAQKAKTVAEKDVPVRYVQDFQRNAKDATSVVWSLVDSNIYDATFVNAKNTQMVYRFTPKGMETRYMIPSKYYPHAITDTVAHQYPKHKVTSLYTRNFRNKVTYQARIAQKKCFLSKKEKNVKLLNFETDGKFIDAEEVK